MGSTPVEPFAGGDRDALPGQSAVSSQLAEAIAEFYRSRSNRPVWVDQGRLNRHGVRLLQVLINSHEQGIDLPDLRLAAASGALQRIAAEETIIYDSRLTELFLRYAQVVGTGRLSPSDVGMTWAIERPRFEPKHILGQLQHGQAADLLDEQPPPHEAYRLLVVALARYRQIVADGGWPVVPHGPVLELGQSSERTSALRRRLAREGYLSESEADFRLFDDRLQQAVRAFQERHGLIVDGRVGNETLSALNMSAAARVAQIEMNMERWRWMPRELPATRIEVNVAAAELTVFDDDRPVLAMRTIVGSPQHRTPMLQAAVEAVIVNPVWNVPTSIVMNEILPRLRRDPGYLRQQDIRILDRPEDPYGAEIDWKTLPRGRYFRLQQQPGPLNALGRLKFDIPNRFDVYLHDTPTKALFARAKRTLSHGCVRLQDPDLLAIHLLGGFDERLAPDPADLETLRIPLQQAVPVYLLYWTAFGAPDGPFQFRGDVYGHDARMQAALPIRIKELELSQLSTGGCHAG